MKKEVSDQLHEKFLIERNSVYEKFPTVFYDETSGESTEVTVGANEQVAADRVAEFRKRIPEIVTAEAQQKRVSNIITALFVGLFLTTVTLIIGSNSDMPALSFLSMMCSTALMILIAFFSIKERFLVSKNSKKTDNPTFDLEHLVATDLLADFGIGEEYLDGEKI